MHSYKSFDLVSDRDAEREMIPSTLATANTSSPLATSATCLSSCKVHYFTRISRQMHTPLSEESTQNSLAILASQFKS